MYQPGEWAWSLEHRQACRIVEAQDLWGEVFYRVWVPSEDAVVWVRDERTGILPELTPILILRVEGQAA